MRAFRIAAKWASTKCTLVTLVYAHAPAPPRRLCDLKLASVISGPSVLLGAVHECTVSYHSHQNISIIKVKIISENMDAKSLKNMPGLVNPTRLKAKRHLTLGTLILLTPLAFT